MDGKNIVGTHICVRHNASIESIIMKKLIKICGMRDSENIRDIIGIKPDMLGLIFYPGSPRYVSDPEKLVSVFKNRKDIKLVGVFVNEEIIRILELHNMLEFDFVQLHGQEKPDYCMELKAQGSGLKAQGLKIIKAFGISEPVDFEKTDGYKNIADFFLFDTKTSSHGGSGRKFDWEVLESYDGETPFLLSGGIGPGDFPDIQHPAFAGLDLNSRFEISPGLKDLELLKNYLKKVRDDQ